MNDYNQRAEKVLLKINELASISEDQHCLTRRFGTTAFVEGSHKVLSWMKETGLQTSIDNIGNVRGKLMSDKKGAKSLVIASHIDSVVNAGKFDGPLGVILGLDLLENLVRVKAKLPFHIELIAFCDEEGVRFHTTFLGSKVVAGSFNEDLLEKKDESGEKLLNVIQAMGGNASRLVNDAIAQNEWLGYFEIHIEQGPVLYERDIPVAIVTAIAAQKRIEIIFKGIAGHAGTVPMDKRKDALCCAAEFIVETEKFAVVHKNKIVATIGKLNITNAAGNVIPGEVVCSLDVRSDDENVLAFSYQELYKICGRVCTDRSISFAWDLVQETKPVNCDTEMNQFLAKSIKDAGYECVSLVSGAGHDAVPISSVSPVAMLFVRCYEGISHNPKENVECKDIEAALRISENFIYQLIKKYDQ